MCEIFRPVTQDPWQTLQCLNAPIGTLRIFVLHTYGCEGVLILRALTASPVRKKKDFVYTEKTSLRHEKLHTDVGWEDLLCISRSETPVLYRTNSGGCGRRWVGGCERRRWLVGLAASLRAVSRWRRSVQPPPACALKVIIMSPVRLQCIAELREKYEWYNYNEGTDFSIKR